MTRRCRASMVGVCGLAVLAGACDPALQEIRIAAQDFRFIPQEIRLQARQPARFVILNEGRERHEISSQLLVRAAVRPASASSSPQTDGQAVPLQPGQAIEIQFTPDPGIYEIRCLVKGHAGMRGLVIVEG